MTAPRSTRVRLLVLLGAVSAVLVVAVFALRPSRAARSVTAAERSRTGGQVAAVHPRTLAAHGVERAGDSMQRLGSAGGAAFAQTALPQTALAGGAAQPVDPEELARRHEERRQKRAAARAAWEERKSQRRAEARARALELAKDNPAQLAHLQAQYARRDERAQQREERREQRRKEREERAARPAPSPSQSAPRASDAPVLGPPVLGADGVAYDPRQRAH